MKKFLVMAALMMIFAVSGAKAQGVEFYTGVEYDRANFDYRTSTSKAFAFNRSTDSVGADVALTGYVSQHVGLTADVSGTFTGGRNSTSLVTAMGGLQVKAHQNPRFQPYVRVMAGLARQKLAADQLNFKVDAADTSFAGDVGVGLDIAVHKGSRTKFRLFQVDYLHTNTYGDAVGFFKSGNNHLRVGTGITW